MRSDCHHGAKGDGHTLRAVFIERAQGRGFYRVHFRGSPHTSLSHAFFIKSLSAGFRKKSGSLSRYVSGLTNAISDFPFKIKGRRACRFESFHYLCSRKHGSSSVGRAPVSKTGCREFEPLLPCNRLIRQSHRSRNINQLMRL